MILLVVMFEWYFRQKSDKSSDFQQQKGCGYPCHSFDCCCLFLVILIWCFLKGIPEQPEAPPAAHIPVSGEGANLPAQTPQSEQPASTPSTGPNANPLDLFPQVLLTQLLW